VLLGPVLLEPAPLAQVLLEPAPLAQVLAERALAEQEVLVPEPEP
jgi:hypothetical protein